MGGRRRVAAGRPLPRRNRRADNDTVAKWDPQATSQRIELAVGRDLQFIRINGTLVGGLAGLIIYTLEQAILMAGAGATLLRAAGRK